MTDRSVFDHGPVERDVRKNGLVYECQDCGHVGETLYDFEQYDCPPQ